MDRRDFLKSAGVGSLATAAAQSARGPIRAGVLGTAHSHTTGKLKAMQDSPDYEVAAVCEPKADAKAKAQASAAFRGLPFVSEADLLGDRSIELIIVECNVWEALPLGNKVIAAGKHLHTEKPPGNDWAGFKSLVEEARRKRLLLQTGYVWRWNEGVLAAIEAAQKGWLGQVQLIRGTMNADRDAAQRAVEAKYRGGGFFELAGHVIDPTVRVLGRPKEVKSWLRHHTNVRDELADNNVAVFEFDKALAVISQSAQIAGATDHRSFEVIGTDGTITVWPEANPPRMRVYMRKPQGPYKAGWQDIALGPQPRFTGDFRELARAIKSGTPLQLSYDHELQLHETLLRASGELS
jgi:predicted dehydrogenase